MNPFTWLSILKAGIAQKSAGDLALAATGLGLAGTSVAFAAYMVATSDQGPRINSAENLAIFARPAAAPYNMGLARGRAQEYDMTPVGTVRTRVGATSAPPEKAVAAYHMRGYSQGEALVQGPDGFITVKIGEEIAGLGRVTAIEARGRNIVVITTGGMIAGDD